MRPRAALALFAAGVIVLACGWFFGPASEPVMRQSVATGRLLFPDLAPRLQRAARVEIAHGGKTLAIDKTASGTWGLADRGGYPVEQGRLRGLLTALTELRLVEPRTADPASFARLGVAEAEGSVVRVLDAEKQPIVSLIVGHRRARTQGNLPEQVYVRLPGQDQAWLAEGRLDADADPQLWLDRDLMSIAPERIATVTVHRGGETLAFARQDGKLVLAAPAAHPPLEAYKVEDVGRALEALTFQDVRPAQDAPGRSEAQSVFTTGDGLTVTATLAHDGKDLWVRFAAAGEDKAKPEAAALAAKLGGWAYQLGAWKEKSLAPTLDDLKAEPPKPAPAPAPGRE